MTDAFIDLNEGTFSIEDSTFHHVLTLRALLWFSDQCSVQIKNSHFEKIVSLQQVSMIWSISNPTG